VLPFVEVTILCPGQPVRVSENGSRQSSVERPRFSAVRSNPLRIFLKIIRYQENTVVGEVGIARRKVAIAHLKVPNVLLKISAVVLKTCAAAVKVGNVVAKVSDVVVKVGNVAAKVSDVVAKVSDVVAKVSDVVAKVSDVVAKVSDVVAKVSDVVVKTCTVARKSCVVFAKMPLSSENSTNRLQNVGRCSPKIGRIPIENSFLGNSNKGAPPL
jgi:hypothetical protein